MPGTLTDPIVDAARAMVDQIEAHLREASREVRKPPPARVPSPRNLPTFQPFYAAAIALAYAHDQGYGTGAQERGQEVLMEMTAEVRRTGTIEWQGHVFQVQQLVDVGRAVVAAMQRFLGAPIPGEPNPAQVATESVGALARSVAWLTSWRNGHHRLVHRPEAIATAAYNGAEAAAADAIGDALVQTAQAIRHLDKNVIPELREQLGNRLMEVRERLLSADDLIRADLRQLARELATEVTKVVRWITREVVPHVEELIETEAALRRAAVRLIRLDLRDEATIREATDASIMAQLAPLVAWAGAFGLQTTTKVNKLEPSFDRLLGPAFDMWAAFLIPGAFAALVTRMVTQSADTIPAIIGGLEDQAARMLDV